MSCCLTIPGKEIPVEDERPEARRTVGKWLKEEPYRLADPKAISELCADYDKLEEERDRLRDALGVIANSDPLSEPYDLAGYAQQVLMEASKP